MARGGIFECMTGVVEVGGSTSASDVASKIESL